jgi:hypothetical protein
MPFRQILKQNWVCNLFLYNYLQGHAMACPCFLGGRGYRWQLFNQQVATSYITVIIPAKNLKTSIIVNYSQITG